MQLRNLYAGKGYKKLLIVPIVLFFVFWFLILAWPQVPRGIDLQGGTLIIIRGDKPIDAVELRNLLLQEFDLLDLRVNSISGPSGTGVNVQFAGNKLLMEAEALLDSAKSTLETNPAAARQSAVQAVALLSPYLPETLLPAEPDEAVAKANEYFGEASKNINNKMQQLIVQRFGLGSEVAFQKKEISPTLGASFWQTAFNVAIVAVALIIIVIFVFFRKLIPSIAVIAAAVFDISGALALMAVFGIPLGLSSIPALLMLLGYSVDTDIMLTTRMLQRREKTPGERAHQSMITGLTMTGTTIAALAAMLIIAYLNQIFIIFEIAAVLLFGLSADIISTWLMNAPILLWYVEKKTKVIP